MGEVFSGRYELVDPVGEGGSGHVWRAWDRKQQRYVAAKVLRQVDAGSLLRFMREQAVRIEHHHVLTPVGWIGEDDRVLFTLPLVRGGSVATLVADYGALPASWVATLCAQTLLALEQIHGQGLVHRDVKPANLLLDATGSQMPRLRLSDFGIAAGVDEPRLTTGGVALGTQGYLAPECLTSGWDPDPRADLYAVGMTAVQMLTGAPPTMTMPRGPGQAENDVPPEVQALRRREVDASLVALIEDLTRARPDERPASASIALQRLSATGLVPDEVEDLDGEIEVFDHVPPLPLGWSTQGPESTAIAPDAAVTAAPAPQAAVTVPQASVTAPQSASEKWADEQVSAPEDPTTTPGARAGTSATPGARDSARSITRSPAVWGWAALVGLGVVLLIVALVLAMS